MHAFACVSLTNKYLPETVIDLIFVKNNLCSLS